MTLRLSWQAIRATTRAPSRTSMKGSVLMGSGFGASSVVPTIWVSPAKGPVTRRTQMRRRCAALGISAFSLDISHKHCNLHASRAIIFKGVFVGDWTSKSHKSQKDPSEPAGKPRRAKDASQPSVNGHAPATTSAGTLDLMKALLSATEPGKPEPSGAMVPAPAKAEKPYWYRAPDSKARKLFEKIAVMRTAGHPDAAIAKRLHTTEQTVRTTVYLANKNGWVDDDGEPLDVEAELAMDVDRKIVRNISRSLDGEMTNWQTHEMTIAAAKGRGHFKNHDKAEGGPAQLPVVAIRIEMPSLGMADHNIIEANVGGTPAYIEGELADGPERESNGTALVPAAPDAVAAG